MKQVKKILTIFLNSIFAATLLSSCSKDLGNYDYQDINKLEITTDMTQADSKVFMTADSIDLSQNDSLKVKLKIAQTLGSAEDFNYEWLITQYSTTAANPSQYAIASTAALATKITLAPNLYKLIAKVTDKNSGVSYYKHFALNVSAAPWGNEGWIILQDQPDGSDISVITTQNGVAKGNVYHNVYSLYNGHKLPVGTNKVNVINYTAALRAQKVSFFYPNGGLEVRSTDFADSSKAEGWFATHPGAINFQANSAVGGTWEYLINNNQISYRQVSAQILSKPPVYFSPPYLGSFSVSPFVITSISSDSWYTLFDKTNRCFFLLRGETSTLVPALPDLPNKHFANYAGTAAALHPTTGSGFDLNNMKDNLIHAENAQPLSTGNGYWNCFFRNDNKDNTYLVQFARAIAYANNFTAGRFQLTQANCPGINSATMFASPTHVSLPNGVFYYVNGSDIYTCTVRPLAASTAQVAQKGFAFPAGTVIKAMKTFNSGYTAANITKFNVPEGKVLVVATEEGGVNKVYFLSLSANGDIIQTPANVFTGFGKITDIAFKKGLGL